MRSRGIVGLVGAVALTLVLACDGADSEVNRRVALRLSKESTPTEQFTISTHQRVVRLKGVVHSGAERESLERAAREVTGVAGVENLLVVDAPVELTKSAYEISSMNDPSDAMKQDEIRRRLDAQALGDVAVEVKDGVATFRGNVAPPVHAAAIQIAIDAKAEVDDRMTLSQP